MDVPKGLAGVVITETKISSTKDSKLTYAGYPIEELKDLPYEAVVYLLWHKNLPNAEQLKAMQQDLLTAMHLPDETIRLMGDIAIEPQHPMSILRTMVSLLGTTNNDGKLDEPREILGKMLTTIAAIIRLRDSQPQMQVDPEWGVVENFMFLFMGRRPSKSQVRMFNTVMVLHADHELNASTFTSRVVASTNADFYSCLTAAVCALKGPLHGGANEQVFNMLQEIRHTGVSPQRYIDSKIANHEKIMGFGHRVYKEGDPRAKILRGIAEEMADETNNQPFFEIQEQIARYMLEKLGLHPNVDYYTAVVYHSLGLDESTFTVMFAACRTAGWLAHIMEQRDEACLIRPASEYVGPTDRHVKPVADK